MTEVAALVLAAGRASRWRAGGGVEPTKLVANYRGRPLVRHAVEAALGSVARPVVVVVGHARAEVEAALAGLDARFVFNADFAEGLATSLKAGVAALPAEIAGAVVLLGDMPEVSPAGVDALAAAFLAMPTAKAAAPWVAGRRGNPVLIGRALFSAVGQLRGDEGARGLLQALAPGEVAAVEVEGSGVLRDIDAPADMRAPDMLAAGIETAAGGLDTGARKRL